jgi:SAM-dependent methyltransferase
MASKLEWEGATGEIWAEQWRHTDQTFLPLQTVLLDRAIAVALDSHRTSARILDIGCGAGSTTLALAQALPEAHLLGIDISPALVGAATVRTKGVQRCAFAVADAAVWSDPDFVPDLLFSRHGVMFFDDPVAAFRNLMTHSSAGARLIFSCFRSPRENPWASGIGALLPGGPPPPPPAGAQGPFAFADGAIVSNILARSGWIDAVAEPVDFSYVAGAGADPVADALSLFQQIGPAARMIQTLEGEERAAFLARLKQFCANHESGGVVSFPAAAWIWTAQKAGA